MAPQGLDKPEKAFVAIMHGLEVGLPPMQALQSIAVINGRPSIWGDGAIGLVRGSGLCEYVRERIDGSDDERVAVCEAKRKNETEPVIGRFSVAQAKRAGLWTKAGPWKDYPERMLQMRARAFALRDGFADVLRGLHIAEEIADIPAEARDVTPPPAPAAPRAPAEVIHVPQSQQGQGRRTPPPAHDPETGEIADDDDGSGIPFHMRDEHDERPNIGTNDAEPEATQIDADAPSDDGSQDSAESEQASQRAPAPKQERMKKARAALAEAERIDPEQWLQDITKKLRAAKDGAALNAIWLADAEPHKDALPPPDFSEAEDTYRACAEKLAEK
jgi:hypothetical protein